MGLPKANRLKHRHDFRAVYKKGGRYSSPHLILRTLSDAREGSQSERPATQIGISISQKVSKKAVIRNRIKRQIRAALRALLPQILPGWKVVIVVCPGAVECNYEHFLRELKQLLIRAEIIHGHSRKHLL